jgi:hypothetical protein
VCWVFGSRRDTDRTESDLLLGKKAWRLSTSLRNVPIAVECQRKTELLLTHQHVTKKSGYWYGSLAPRVVAGMITVSCDDLPLKI